VITDVTFYYWFTSKVDIPPSTWNICPEIQELSSLSKNLAVLAMSSAVPTLFNGWRWADFSFFSSLLKNFSANGVSVNDGAITLTLIFGAYSAAQALAKPSIAPLAAATLV